MNQPNPYQAPEPNVDRHVSEEPSEPFISFRVFERSLGIVWSRKRAMQQLRLEAESFINAEIGVENVVSIVEASTYRFEVIVWYRAGGSETASEHTSND